MTENDNTIKELSRVARDYFGFKALVGAMAIGVAIPYFIPVSLPAVVAWLFLYRKSLSGYGKRGALLYYLAPMLAVIGTGLGFFSSQWRWAMSMIFVFSMFPMVLYVTKPSELWENEKSEKKQQ